MEASKDAYGAVSYLRFEYDHECYELGSSRRKRRLSLLKPMFMPRLELMAAILGLNLTTTIASALNIPIADAHFWSNSMDVLYWIRGGERQFRLFLPIELEKFNANRAPNSGSM